MPFSVKDVEKHTKKATSDKLKRQWVEVANSALERCEGDAETCDASAIRQANSVIAKEIGEIAEFGSEMFGSPVGGATSFADAFALEKANQASDTIIERTFQFQDIVRNILRSEAITDKVGAIRELADEYIAHFRDDGCCGRGSRRATSNG
jgi:hypothetical protein